MIIDKQQSFYPQRAELVKLRKKKVRNKRREVTWTRIIMRIIMVDTAAASAKDSGGNKLMTVASKHECRHVCASLLAKRACVVISSFLDASLIKHDAQVSALN